MSELSKWLQRRDLRDQVGLELVQINVERTNETQRRSDGRDNLSDETVKVREARGRNAKVLLANVVNSFVIHLDPQREHVSVANTI